MCIWGTHLLEENTAYINCTGTGFLYKVNHESKEKSLVQKEDPKDIYDVEGRWPAEGPGQPIGTTNKVISSSVQNEHPSSLSAET